jgi:hypothetical protein
MASVNKDVTPTDRVDLDFCAFFAPFLLLFCSFYAPFLPDVLGGFSQTAVIRVQFLVLPDQRSGFGFFAASCTCFRWLSSSRYSPRWG